AGIYALMTWIVTGIIRGVQPSSEVGGAFLAAFLAGAFMLLPFLGAFLAIVPPALLVIIQTPPDALIFKLVLLIFLLGAAQHVVLNLIAPRVYGHHLGMDPIILFAALLLGAKEGGIWGAFFAAPIVAIGYAIFETFYDRLTSTHPLFQVQERIEEKIQRSRPFEDLAREVRPRIVPVRTRETHHTHSPSAQSEQHPPPISGDANGTTGLGERHGVAGSEEMDGATAAHGANNAMPRLGSSQREPPISTSAAPDRSAPPHRPRRRPRRTV
nr:AI-2E family transporter [Ktedonobacterales bacterium]